MESDGQKAQSRQGFTLLETLLALAIAGVVLGLVFSAWQTFRAVYAASEERETGSAQVLRALQAVIRDLSCGFRRHGDAPSLELLPPDTREPGSDLALLTLLPDLDQGDPLLWHTMESVRYRLQPDTRGGFDLLRLSHAEPATDAVPPATNLLLTGVARFNIQLLLEGAWLDHARCDGQGAWPQAARISILLKGMEQPEEAECLMPAGLTVTSRLQRASAVAF